MVDVPATLVVTMPVEPPTGLSVLLLLHVPPVVESLKSVGKVAQIFRIPEIIAGSGFTVATVVAIQPAGDV